MQKWEYQTVAVLQRPLNDGTQMWFSLKGVGDLEEERLINDLYRLGEDGWELVTSLGGNFGKLTLIFKRPKQE